MSIKYIHIVARIHNATDSLCVKNDPKAIARYIDDHNLYDVLLGTKTTGDYKMVIAGTDGKGEDAHMCFMVGATVPSEYIVEYTDIVKGFDNALCPNNSSLFWSHNATYIIVEHHSHTEWWTSVIKEMNNSYQIEVVSGM